MGDRGNICVRDGVHPPVYLYTHWSGSEILTTARDALIRGKERWQDPTYLTRIVFCEMVSGSESGLTGFGIGSFVNDNEHWIVVLDSAEQRVLLCAKPEWKPDTPLLPGETLKSWPFADFARLSDEEIETLQRSEYGGDEEGGAATGGEYTVEVVWTVRVTVNADSDERARELAIDAAVERLEQVGHDGEEIEIIDGPASSDDDLEEVLP